MKGLAEGRVGLTRVQAFLEREELPPRQPFVPLGDDPESQYLWVIFSARATLAHEFFARKINSLEKSADNFSDFYCKKLIAFDFSYISNSD